MITPLIQSAVFLIGPKTVVSSFFFNHTSAMLKSLHFTQVFKTIFLNAVLPRLEAFIEKLNASMNLSPRKHEVSDFVPSLGLFSRCLSIWSNFILLVFILS